MVKTTTATNAYTNAAKSTARSTRSVRTLLGAAALAALLIAPNAWAQTQGWAGTWKDSAGGILALTEAEGMLTLYGTDAQSIYFCRCVVDPKQADSASCVGDGYNHTLGYAFTYRSRMKLSSDSLAEAWEASARSGNVSGQSAFKRSPRAAR